jgi:hypothetical protein
MNYYVMLQAHIAEARNADLLDMLLIPANMELMVLLLTALGEESLERGSWPAARRG